MFANILQTKPLFQGVDSRSESGVDALGRFFLHARQDMRVDVQGSPDFGMTKAFAHYLGIDPLFQENRRM